VLEHKGHTLVVATDLLDPFPYKIKDLLQCIGELELIAEVTYKKKSNEIIYIPSLGDVLLPSPPLNELTIHPTTSHSQINYSCMPEYQEKWMVSILIYMKKPFN
jgi:hypothetical protein